MVKAIAVCAALFGCHNLLGLKELQPEGSADATTGDVANDGPASHADSEVADAGACIPGPHDEDSDGKKDNCDNCPTYANGPQIDGDGDGVGEACDWLPSVGGDVRRVFAPMTSTAGLTYQGGFGTDEISLAQGGYVATATELAGPTLVETRFTNTSSFGPANMLGLSLVTSNDSIGCLLAAAPCSGGPTGGGCLWAVAGATFQQGVLWPLAVSNATRMELRQSDDQKFVCTLTDVNATTYIAVTGMGVLLPGRLIVDVRGNASALIYSFSGYGR